jgi:predicted ABC-type ATPase
VRVLERQREPGEHFTSSHPSSWTPETHDTATVYQRGGQYTAERQALHKQIADRILVDVQPVAEPVVYFLGGGPGSGKSTLIADGHIEIPDRTHAAHVSADDVKTAFTEYGLAKHAGNSSAAVLVHEESSYVAKAIASRALAESKNVVVDNVGDSGIDKLEARLEKYRKDGATKIVASYVTISTEEAIKRADLRGQQTGRMVPHAIIRESHADVTRTLSAAIERNLFDTVSLYDNTHTPKLIAKADKGVLTVHDREAWDRFQRKAHR